MAIGGPPPARVVRAWLIGVGVFQGGAGRATFRSIQLVDGDRVTDVLAPAWRGRRSSASG